jgi:hypothetical protein
MLVTSVQMVVTLVQAPSQSNGVNLRWRQDFLEAILLTYIGGSLREESNLPAIRQVCPRSSDGFHDRNSPQLHHHLW